MGSDFNATYSRPILIQQITASGSRPVSGTLDAIYSTPSFATLNVRYDHRLPKGVTLYAGVDNVTDFVETTLGKPAFRTGRCVACVDARVVEDRSLVASAPSAPGEGRLRTQDDRTGH